MMRIITLCAVGIKFHRICAADEHLRSSKLSTQAKFFQEKFEQISLHCHRFAELIPVTFVLGFYVSIVITRFRCAFKHGINNWTTYKGLKILHLLTWGHYKCKCKYIT